MGCQDAHKIGDRHGAYCRTAFDVEPGNERFVSGHHDLRQSSVKRAPTAQRVDWGRSAEPEQTASADDSAGQVDMNRRRGFRRVPALHPSRKLMKWFNRPLAPSAALDPHGCIRDQIPSARGNEPMAESEIDAVRALLSAKPRPVGWDGAARGGSTRSARSGRWPTTSSSSRSISTACRANGRSRPAATPPAC